MDAILNDRATQLLMSADHGLDYDEARARLERAALVLVLGAGLDEAHQALAIAAARCAARMFKGGVFVEGDDAQLCRVGAAPLTALRRALLDLGIRPDAPPQDAPRLAIGLEARAAPQALCLFAWCDGWIGCAGPHPPESATPGNVLAGLIAASLAVTELFRRTVMSSTLACRRTVSLSAWGPGAPGDATIKLLPQAFRFVGAGNLGQAALFAMSTLPWRDPGEASLIITDIDRAGPENLDVQLLTTHQWVGLKKARAAAAWADGLGFKASVDERRFGAASGPQFDEPRLVFAGVDNLQARRAIAGAGFDAVIDAGLGATGAEAFDLRLHLFPGAISADQAWPQDAAPVETLPENVQKLLAAGRVDRCGALRIAGQGVGAPTTALAAAALQWGQALRLVETGRASDKIDVGLTDPARAFWRDMPADPSPIAAIEARAG